MDRLTHELPGDASYSYQILEALSKARRILYPFYFSVIHAIHSKVLYKDEYEKTMSNGHGYFLRPEDFRRRREAHAGATLYTTAEDYAKFVCAVLNGQGLRQETLKEMLTSQIDMNKEMGVGWSLGFGTQQDANGMAFWQWRDYGIFRDYIIAYPKEKAAVVYLANSFYGLSICPEIVASSMGGQALGSEALEYSHWDSPIYQFAWAVKEKGAQVVEEQLSDLKKKDPKKITTGYIRFKEGRLFYLRDGGTFSEYRPLTAESKDTFVLEGLATFRLKIEFDEEGNPIKLLGVYADGRQDQTVRNK